MKSYKFIVEKTNTGFSAFAEDDNLHVYFYKKNNERFHK